MATWAQQDLRARSSIIEAALRRESQWLSQERILLLFWMAALATVVAMGIGGSTGWDARICGKAIHSLRSGADPYAAGISDQQSAGSDAIARQGRARSLYAYSPMTLPLLRVLGLWPNWLLSLFFCTATGMGFILQVRAGYLLAEADEQRWLKFLLPAVAFFPGLVTDDAILSGNLAYLLYGLVLTAAVPGWKRDQWRWFYFAVLVASVFKAPLLTLLAFPVLVGKRQWFGATSTGVVGLALFAGEAWLRPDLCAEYLKTIRIMFDVGHDFGYGPVGVLGDFLWRHGRPYSQATTLAYLAFAGGMLLFLLFLARQARRGNCPRQVWVSVALMGTFLLNPRIMKYDMAAITIPMLLIAWRGMRAVQGWTIGRTGKNARETRRMIAMGAGCFLAANLITVLGPRWVPVELIVLLAVFSLGTSLLQQPAEVKLEIFVPSPSLLELPVPEEV